LPNCKLTNFSPKNIILFGFPKSGKTFLGKILSKKLNLNFLDTDELIEKHFSYKFSKTQIFKFLGKENFIKLEQDLIASFLKNNNKSLKNTIITLGGSTLFNPINLENLQLYHDDFFFFFFDIEKSILFQRFKNLAKDQFPAYLEYSSFSEISFSNFYDKRKKAYDKIFHNLKNSSKVTLQENASTNILNLTNIINKNIRFEGKNYG
jgi:shikimate kinase